MVIYPDRVIASGTRYVILALTNTGSYVYVTKTDSMVCLVDNISMAYPFESEEEANTFIQTTMKHSINYRYPIKQFKIRKITLEPKFNVEEDVDVSAPSSAAIIISGNDYMKYGCPYCGCEATLDYSYLNEKQYTIICPECYNDFIVNTNNTLDSYPAQEHPNKNSWHEFVKFDPRPSTTGEYCQFTNQPKTAVFQTLTEDSALRIMDYIKSIRESSGIFGPMETVVEKTTVNGGEPKITVRIAKSDKVNTNTLIRLVSQNDLICEDYIVQAMAEFIEDPEAATEPD